MRLRAIIPQDHEGLVALWVRAWQPVFPQIDFAARRDFIRARLVEYGTPPCLALMLEDAGFLLLNPLTGELEQIAVDPAFQGKGLARQPSVATLLLEEAKRLSPQGLHLSVNQHNLRAIRFYTRHGFTMTGQGTSAASGLPLFFMRWGVEKPFLEE